MATQFEYKLVELAGVFRSDILNLDSFAPDRALAELRKEGWALASTGVSMSPHSHPQNNLCALRITYALKRPAAPNPGDRKEKLHAMLHNLPKRP